jgi:hypothetical protein
MVGITKLPRYLGEAQDTAREAVRLVGQMLHLVRLGERAQRVAVGIGGVHSDRIMATVADMVTDAYEPALEQMALVVRELGFRLAAEAEKFVSPLQRKTLTSYEEFRNALYDEDRAEVQAHAIETRLLHRHAALVQDPDGERGPIQLCGLCGGSEELGVGGASVFLAEVPRQPCPLCAHPAHELNTERVERLTLASELCEQARTARAAYAER